MSNARDVKEALDAQASSDDAKALARFFKTGPGEYGEGDRFIGVRVPVTRRICAQYRELPIREIPVLANSPIHEHRLAAVVLLTDRFQRAKDEATRDP